MPLTLTRLVIVDDNDGFRRASAALFNGDGFTVVGTAATGEQALEVTRTDNPEAVLLDIRLPDVSGFDIARQLRDAASPPQVILVSSLSRDDVEGRLDGLDVLGFIPKSALTPEAVRALLREPR